MKQVLRYSRVLLVGAGFGLLAVYLLMLLAVSLAHAEALVVQSCGNLPLQYFAGATRIETVDVNGIMCANSVGPTGITQGVTAAGNGARVAQDPTQLFWDDFGTGTLDTAAVNNLNHKWITPSTGGGGNATAANNQVAATTLGSGTTANGFSILQSQKSFKGVNPGWLYFQESNNFEFPVLTNAVRFWGFATFPATPTAAAPYADAEGFELGTDGHLRAVTSASPGSLAPGTRLVINDLSLPCPATTTASSAVTINQATLTAPAGKVVANEFVTGPGVPFGTTVSSVSGTTVTMNNNATATLSGVYTFKGQCANNLIGQIAQPQDASAHAYIMYVRGDRIFWAIDQIDNIVAQTLNGAPGPNVNTLPIAHLAVAGTTGPSSSALINVNAAIVGDTARNEVNVCDPTLPQNCLTVEQPSGPVPSTVSAIPAQALMHIFNGGGTWNQWREIQTAAASGTGTASVAIAPTSAAAGGITPVVSSTTESGHVLKASAGNFYSLVTTVGASAGFVMVFNSTTVPADGAVTPIECVAVAANSTVSINYNPGPPSVYGTGISAAFSTTGCFTKTASATAFFSGKVQ